MITTVEEVQARLGITDNDTRIGALLEGVELDFINETKNRFLNRCIYSLSNFVFTNSRITNSNAEFVSNYFLPDKYIYVMGSVHNDGYHLVTAVDESYLALDSTLIDEDSSRSIVINQCEFPLELKNLIADIIGVTLKKENGVTSESWGSYSVSYSDVDQKIDQRVNKFRKKFW